MAEVVSKALILGHSFVRRLKRDLELGFYPRAAYNFRLHGAASVHLHGVGSRTVQMLQANDLHVVRDLAPDIVILEIGTNDLTHTPPEIVGSNIDDLVRLLIRDFAVRPVGVCGVIPCGISVPHALSFWESASVLNQYVGIVLDDLSNVFCWSHAEFNSPKRTYTGGMAFTLIQRDSIYFTVVIVAPF